MKERFAAAKIIPVLIFDAPEYALPTAAALIDGGFDVLEITLRTDAAWEALAAVIAAHPDAAVGIGTALEPAQLKRAKEMGATFAVSPGYDPDLAGLAADLGMFFLPGVATASEVMQARRAGLNFLKFFPAEPAGGRAFLNSLASPFPDIQFCPTGGINGDNFADYLALGNVACVGGSWLANAQDMAAGNWAAITDQVRNARSALR